MILKRVKKIKKCILLGKNNDCKIWQVLTYSRFSSDNWSCYFLVEKNGRKKRIYSNKLKHSITKYFFGSINYIVLKLADGCDVISYSGSIDDYYFWEAWKEDDVKDNRVVYMVFNLKKYIRLTDKDKIAELEAFLLLKNK